MSLIDSILNIVGVLLWFHWCSLRFDLLAGSTPTTLAGTLKRAEKRAVKHWRILGSLGGLLLLRAWLYWQIGSATSWTAKVDLGMIVLAFRSDLFTLSLLYSMLSFLRILVIAYFWLMALAVINWSVEGDQLQRSVRLHLFKLGRAPRWVLVLTPAIVLILAWIALHPLLVKAGLIEQAGSIGLLARQGLLLAISVYFSLKYFLPVVLLLHLVLNYVYLGRSPAWDFIGVTARNMLAPVRNWPLRLGKVDFSPLVAAVLLLLLLDALPNYLAQKYPQARQWLWPH
jgi:uncharacterized protein YggT (Ycf19 family)